VCCDPNTIERNRSLPLNQWRMSQLQHLFATSLQPGLKPNTNRLSAHPKDRQSIACHVAHFDFNCIGAIIAVSLSAGNLSQIHT